jgi:hypothetical protein
MHRAATPCTNFIFCTLFQNLMVCIKRRRQDKRGSAAWCPHGSREDASFGLFDSQRFSLRPLRLTGICHPPSALCLPPATHFTTKLAIITHYLVLLTTTLSPLFLVSLCLGGEFLSFRPLPSVTSAALPISSPPPSHPKAAAPHTPSVLRHLLSVFSVFSLRPLRSLR